MVYEVVHCSECEKPIKSVPAWLTSVDVKFTCESCRQKHPRPFLGPDAAAPVRAGRRGSEDADEETSVAVDTSDSDDDAPIEDLPEDFAEDEPAAEENVAEYPFLVPTKVGTCSFQPTNLFVGGRYPHRMGAMPIAFERSFNA